MLKSHTFHFILCSFIFFISNVQARELLPPRFSANASTGVYTVGQADLMISLDGDQQHNLYVNPQGAYGSDQQWYGDVGLGYRWIKNESAILGWYLFAGHTRVENSSGFWLTNPGLEVMGRRWDARINVYIPVAGRSNELGIKEFDIVNTPVFTGHTEMINSVFSDANAIQQVGNGADARVGYQLFRSVPLKGYLGAYFFDIANADKVRGGAAGLEYWFDDNIRVFTNYSYDNYQHSNVIGGIGISFGGVRNGHTADPSLAERLTDPVERYLANLGHGSGIPSKTLLYGMGSGSRSVLVSDSIAFFSQTGTPNNGGGSLTLANCTFENPCGPTDFSQTGVNTLNNLLPNTRMYFNGGNYFANIGTDPLPLNNGQSIHSRTTDYSAPATGTDRSSFGGGFVLAGNNLLENIILIPFLGGSPLTGVTINGQNNQIRGSDIGNENNRYGGYGIDDLGIKTRIENTAVYARQLGIVKEGNSNLTIQNSTIDVEELGGGAGIIVMGGSVSVIDSAIRLTGTSNFDYIGIQTLSNTNISITNSTIDVVHNSNTGNAVVLSNGNGSNITVIDSNLSVQGTNSSIATGNPVNINSGTVCMVNGVTTVCP
ncbi:MAG: hypothetical protein WBV88_06665 [Candidatus Rickettsiella isopodorum]